MSPPGSLAYFAYVREKRRQWLNPMIPLLVAMAQIWGQIGAQRAQVDPSLPNSRMPLDTLGFALLAVGPLTLLIRRAHPVVTLWTTMAATSFYIYEGYSYGPVFISPIFAIVNAILTGHRRAAWGSGAAFYLFFINYDMWLVPAPEGWFHYTAVGTFILAVLACSEMARFQRDQRVERERIEKEEARRQASEERLTMAQELHDVLGHSISLIHVQASTALHLIDEHPEQARTALATIKQASKDVLTEMRSVLGVLREDAPRTPTAGLGQLDELVERSGPGVTKQVRGTPRLLPPGVERAAYRIVQEALTNVTKHAPGATATVTLEYGRDEVIVRIDDTGATRPGPLTHEGGGEGIPGMRERAAALGGSLVSGRHHRGFRVEARLPVPPPADTEPPEETE